MSAPNDPKKTIKVIWLMRDLNIGGMQKVVIRLINCLKVDSALILLQPGELDSQVEVPKHYLPLPVGNFRGQRLLAYGVLARQIATIINTEKPDILMAFGHSMIVLAVLAAYFVRQPLRLAANIRNSFTELDQAKRPRFDFVHWWFGYALKRVDKVIVVTQALAQQTLQGGVKEENILVIPNGVDAESLHTAAAENITSPWADGDAPIIASVGRLSSQKNQQLLLRAAHLVRQQRPVRLWFIGDGEERKSLQDLALTLGLAQDTCFWGFQPNPYKFVAKADLFVLPSLYEGFPNALLEAMALGAPVIATDCPTGPAELITHKQTGMLVPSNDPVQLAEAILELLNDTALRQTISTNAYKTANDYSFSKTVSLFEHALIGLAS